MGKVVAQSLVLSVLTICLGHQSWAQYWNKKVYDATYTVTASNGSSKLRMMSDGKGRQRSESTVGGNTYVSIIDGPKREMWSLMDAQRVAMRMNYDPKTTASDADGFKALNARPIGFKIIDGHPCHGWQYSVSGATTEAWTGDDVGFVVLSTTTGSGINQVTRLVSFSPQAPNPSLFVVPAGYKVMEVPTAGSYPTAR